MFQWGFSERKTDGEQSHGKVLSKQKLNCILSCNKECLFQLLKEFRLTYHNSNSMGYFKIPSGAFLHEWHVLPLTWFELQKKNRPSVTSVMSDNTLLTEILWQKYWEFSNDIAIVTALQFWEISLFLRMIRHRYLSRLALVDLDRSATLETLGNYGSHE